MRNKLRISTRILALDLHPRSFGYVVMDGAGRLLDWGVKRSDFRTPKLHLEVLVQKRFRPLLLFWRPDVVVSRFGDQNRKAIRMLLNSFRRQAKRIPFFPVRARYNNGSTKHERASVIAELFPEIGWKLPPEREAWQSEYYAMSIFEAAETALTYLNPPRKTACPAEQCGMKTHQGDDNLTVIAGKDTLPPSHI